MIRSAFAVMALAVSGSWVSGQTVYLVPATDAESVAVVFGDSPVPDVKVKVDKLAGLKLFARVDGKDVPVEGAKGEHSLAAKFPKSATVVYGTATSGLDAKSEKPTLSVHHPKAVLAADTASAPVGEAAALEVVPVAEGGNTRFRLLARGKPVGGAEGTVVLPDGGREQVVTDRDGYTADFDQVGRYAAHLKSVEKKSGEHNGQKYEQVCYHATLVVSVTMPRHVGEFLKVKAKVQEDLKPIREAAEKAIEVAKTEDEREKASREARRAARKVYTPAVKRVLDLVRDKAAEDSSVGALVWAAYRTSGDQNEAVELLRKHHLTHRSFVEVMGFYQNAPRGWSEAVLREQLASSKLPESVRPQLMYCLALARRAYSEWPHHLYNSSEDELAEHVEVYGEDTVAGFRSGDPEKAKAESLTLLRELGKKFGTQTTPKGETYADLTTATIFELEHLALGNVAPDIAGEDLDGVKFKLSDYRGKVVVVTFWATWCAPCMRMVPHERELVKRMADKPFVLIGVNGDGDKSGLKQATEKAGITWRSFWCGEKGPEGEIPKAWNVQGWPTVYVLDGKGVIRAKSLTGPALDRVVDRLVGEVEKK